MLLDPWVEPFPSAGPEPIVKDGRPPICIMSSEGFTIWSDHFKRVEALAKDWKKAPGTHSYLMTISESILYTVHL